MRASFGQYECIASAHARLWRRGGRRGRGRPHPVGHRYHPRQVAREFGKNYPNVALRVVEGYSGLLIDGVQAGMLDFAVVNNPGKSSSLKLQPLMSEELVLVFAASQQACNVRTLRLPQLSSLSFVLPARRHGMRVLIDRYLESKSVILTPKLELDSLVPTL